MARGKRKHSKEMQDAAAKYELDRGRTPDQVKEDYPDLADAVDRVSESGQPTPSSRVGSGSPAPRSSLSSRTDII